MENEKKALSELGDKKSDLIKYQAALLDIRNWLQKEIKPIHQEVLKYRDAMEKNAGTEDSLENTAGLIEARQALAKKIKENKNLFSFIENYNPLSNENFKQFLITTRHENLENIFQLKIPANPFGSFHYTDYLTKLTQAIAVLENFLKPHP